MDAMNAPTEFDGIDAQLPADATEVADR